MVEIRSPVCGKLCSALLLEHFGSIVQNVAMDLFKNGDKSLNSIRSTTKFPLSKVKKMFIFYYLIQLCKNKLKNLYIINFV